MTPRPPDPAAILVPLLQLVDLAFEELTETQRDWLADVLAVKIARYVAGRLLDDIAREAA